jgi:hypothetical protein
VQTYSHVIIAAALRKPFEKLAVKKNLPPVRLSALIWGGFFPDLALILLTVFFALKDFGSGLEFGSEDFFNTSYVGKLFNDWFFNNLWVISAQNMFHSPIMLTVFIGLAYFLWRRGVKGAGWVFWLFCACMTHTLVDIPLHREDGPLLLFPFNMHLRFISPVSYWDPEHYGRQFFVFEHALDALLLTFFISKAMIAWVKRRRNKQNLSIDKA